MRDVVMAVDFEENEEQGAIPSFDFAVPTIIVAGNDDKVYTLILNIVEYITIAVIAYMLW
jgi:hypothetical protein